MSDKRMFTKRNGTLHPLIAEVEREEKRKASGNKIFRFSVSEGVQHIVLI